MADMSEDAAATLGSIADEFVCSPECPTCLGSGIVCEEHPTSSGPWEDESCCGAAGEPCPSIKAARAMLGGSDA